MSYTGITSAFQADERGPTPLTRSIKRSPPLWGISFLLSGAKSRTVGASFVTNLARQLEKFCIQNYRETTPLTRSINSPALCGIFGDEFCGYKTRFYFCTGQQSYFLKLLTHTDRTCNLPLYISRCLWMLLLELRNRQ